MSDDRRNDFGFGLDSDQGDQRWARAREKIQSPPPQPSPTINNDPINPSYYRGDLVMRIIEKFGLGFRLGNVVKYTLRHREKACIDDLRKAKWYLEREIEAFEGSSKIGAVE
jgi:hypothetical protein